VKPSGVHLTLKFLGDTPSEQVPDIQKIMDDVTRKFTAFPISVEGIGCFPSQSRPRVIWLGVIEKTGTLQTLREQLENALAALGFSKERRAFHPHLTLGRVKRHTQNADVKNLAQHLNEYPHLAFGKQDFDQISLIKSDLLPSGAVYTKLYSSKLGI
jgi:2'-5' RNA ligase